MPKSRPVFGAIMAVLLVLACSSGATGSPVDTVKQVLGLVEAGQLDKIPDLSCAASKDKAAQEFTFTGALGNLPAGLDAQQVAAAIHVTTSGLSVTESSRTDNAASVAVKGPVMVTVDPEKFKAVLKTYLQGQGLPADDATISAALAGMSDLLNSTQTVDTTADVVLENGAWKICE